MATVLQKVTVPVLSHFECQNTRYGTMVTPTMVCAGYEQGKKVKTHYIKKWGINLIQTKI